MWFENKLDRYVETTFRSNESERLKMQLIEEIRNATRMELMDLRELIESKREEVYNKDDRMQIDDLENSLYNWNYNRNSRDDNYDNRNNYQNNNHYNQWWREYNNNYNNINRIELVRENPETIIISISWELIKNEFKWMKWKWLKSHPKTSEEIYKIIWISENEDDYNRKLNNRLYIDNNQNKHIYLELENGSREEIIILYDKQRWLIKVYNEYKQNIWIARINEGGLNISNSEMYLNINFH